MRRLLILAAVAVTVAAVLTTFGRMVNDGMGTRLGFLALGLTVVALVADGIENRKEQR